MTAAKNHLGLLDRETVRSLAQVLESLDDANCSVAGLVTVYDEDGMGVTVSIKHDDDSGRHLLTTKLA